MFTVRTSEKFFNTCRFFSRNVFDININHNVCLRVVMHLPKHMFGTIVLSLKVRCTEGPTVLQTACPDVVLILQGIEIERC